MPDLQAQYDDAMFAFSQGDYPAAIAGLRAVLAADPAHFDAQLSLGMAYCRQGDFATAIAEGRKAEQLRPHERGPARRLARGCRLPCPTYADFWWQHRCVNHPLPLARRWWLAIDNPKSDPAADCPVGRVFREG